jgi:hypothetical protein
LHISCPYQLISAGDGRCSSERKIASSNVKGVLMADGTGTSLRFYGPCHKKHFLSTKMSMHVYWEFFVTGQKFHPSSTLSKLTREHGGEKPLNPRSEDHARTLSPSVWGIEGQGP